MVKYLKVYLLITQAAKAQLIIHLSANEFYFALQALTAKTIPQPITQKQNFRSYELYYKQHSSQDKSNVNIAINQFSERVILKSQKRINFMGKNRINKFSDCRDQQKIDHVVIFYIQIFSNQEKKNHKFLLIQKHSLFNFQITH